MFDRIAITAANEAQARGYREMLRVARERAVREALVVADPGGRRVGSLGATVNLLRQDGFPQLGLALVVHSGGDARRTPGYAAMGKAFIPMRDGRSLLEHIVEAMAALPLPAGGGLLVVAGDVLPRFDAAGLDFSRPGVTGVAYADSAEEARRHGVYVVDEARVPRGAASPVLRGAASPVLRGASSSVLRGASSSVLRGAGNGAVPVSGLLQKPDFPGGTHLIDTGVMFIDWPTASKMVPLPIAGDIYDEFPKMLLDGFAPFHVNVVGKCDFFHVGSTRELLDKLGDGRTYVDCVGCKLSLAGGNVVTNVPPGRFRTLRLGRGECFTCVPYGRGKWLDLKYRIDDNFKTDGLWENSGLGAAMPHVDARRLLEARRWAGLPRRATAPARIDFAGGWSDTPPICNAEGGTVLNVAVTLDGERPIEATVSMRKDHFVKIVSRDLGRRRLVKTAEELADHTDPTDWCALAKSALKVTGYRFGEDPGLNITMRANLPKGSGMGTSSILGAVVLAALLGRIDHDEIGELTLRLEQEMRTGGGWQDQFGGIVGGVKLLRSKPGERQKIEVEELDAKWLASLLEERGLLFFTGQKRMARNILRKVLAFYAENPHGFAKILIGSLKSGAEAAAEAIRRQDADAFAKAIGGYWRDKTLFDPGSTNDRVEEIIGRIGGRAAALTLTGAGGGGFMFILAKSAKDAAAIRRELANHAPTSLARFHEMAIDQRGIAFE